MPRTFTFASALLGPVLTCALAWNVFSAADNAMPTVTFTPSLHAPAGKDAAAAARACVKRTTPVSPAAERANARLMPAVEDVDGRLGRRYPGVYTGVISCAESGTLFVFRVPGSEAFDQAARAVGQRRHVKVALADARFSHRSLEAARAVVEQRMGALRRAGAPLQSVAVQPEGYVEVAVVAHPERARRVLHDVADRIRLVVQPHPIGHTI